MTSEVLLPLPDSSDLLAWAESLTEVLQNSLDSGAIASNYTAGGGLTLPIYDTGGRVILDEDGIYAYDAFGAVPIAPDIVQIDTTQLVDAAITTNKIANLAVDTAKLADLSVDAAKLATNAVNSVNIVDSAITNVKLADASVDTAKLSDLSVEAAKLANSAVTATKIANLAVGTAAIANGAITNAKIGSLAVDTAQLADAAITSAKIANLAVGSAAIANAAVGTAHIANAAITSALIADAAIVTAKIDDLAVNNAKIANLAVSSAKISDMAADRLRAGTIGAYDIFLGDSTFHLSGADKTLTIQDTQGSPVDRVLIGKLGAGSTDYGIQIRDASGALIFGQTTVASDILNTFQAWGDITGTGKPADYADRTNTQSASAWRNGFEAGPDFDGWSLDTSEGTHTFSAETTEVYSGSQSARITTSVKDTSAGGIAGGVYFAIPEEIALTFAGRRVLVSCYAKAASTGGASSFEMAYSTFDVGNSGWQNFSLTTSWTRYVFAYDVPVPSAGGADYIGIQGDGASGVLYVDSLSIEATTRESDLNALALVNGPAQAGADVTGSNTAAAILGQGALATLNSADWASQVTGTGKPANNADVTSANPQSPSWLTSPVIWSGNKLSSANLGTYMNTAAIGTAYIANAAITNALIANAAISTAKIANLAVTNALIANGAITTAKISDAQITTAKIGNAQITNAKIGTAAVNTLQIAGNAVTVPNSAYTSGEVSYFNTSWNTIQSVTFTSSGQPVALVASCEPSVLPNPNTVDFRILRGSTTVIQMDDLAGLEGGAFCFTASDTPGSGTVTYNFQARSNDPANSRYRSRSLLAIETKR